ncbi:hypothetical protein [Kordia sp.]|uniref:hypothetical protein n=1 Tax=Kordia sp. TaxID=1965332 RepID=UPI003D29EC3A
MKKQTLKSLTLNKIAISNIQIMGGRAQRGESLFNTVCDACYTDDCPRNQDM